MRPVRFTLQAFGPFAGREVVDFTQAMDAGVFGIYGKTGTGKTSLFDGISFALFGESAGNERKAADMISDYKSIETLTEAELVFDLGDRRYVVHRIPDQMRKAKRGDQETPQKHEAYLFDATGLSLSEITQDNRGKIIAEKKVSTVDAAVSELLGYDAAQFRQIVLLPQGEFRKILTVSSDDRSAILKRLFDVSIFETLTSRLQERAKEVRRDIEAKRSERSTILDYEDCESVDMLATRIADGTSAVKALDDEVAKLKKTSDIRQKALIKGEALNKKFLERDLSKSEQENLKADSPRIEGIGQRLQMASNAKDIVPIEGAFQKAKRALQDIEARIADAGQRKNSAAEAHQVSNVILQQASDKEPERQAATKQISQLQQLLSQLSEANLLKAPADKAQALLEGALKVEGTAANLLQGTEVSLDKLKRDRKAAAEHLIQLQKAETEFGLLEQDAARAEAYEHAVANKDAVKSDVTAAMAAHKSALENKVAAQIRFDQTEADLSQVQAIHLAHSLVPGQPCPVCGSGDHPKVATGDSSSAGLDERFDTAKLRLSAAMKAEQQASLKLTSDTTRIEEREATLAKLPKGSAGHGELITQLDKYRDLLQNLRTNKQYENLETRIAESEQKTLELRRQHDEARNLLTETKSRQAVTASQYQKALLAIPQDLRGDGVITARAHKSSQELEASIQAHKQAIDNERMRSEAVTSIHAEQQTLDHEYKRQQQTCQEELENYQACLVNVSISDEEFQQIKPDIENIKVFEDEIQQHRQKLAMNADRIKRLSSEIGTDELPNLPVLQEVVNVAGQFFTETSRKATEQAAGLQRLSSTSEKLQKLSVAIHSMEKSYAPLGELADLVYGNNTFHVRLTDFAIASMLDEVFAAANQRLLPMTDGRFELHRDEERAGGSGKRGLDIMVFDGNSQKSKPTRALSGGESFQAALALALGLSDVVQQTTGGIKLDTIFIDEGFGSLDSDALETALDTLRDLQGDKRSVGVISHLDQVKQEITVGFDVYQSSSGSHVLQRTGAA